MSDIFYYNIVMNGSSPFPASLAQFDETRTQNIVENAGEYYMSVIRFSIDASHIPLFVCPVIYDNLEPSNINKTPYVLYLRYNNIIYSENLQYIPDSIYQQYQLPSPPINNKQDNSTEYYYVFYYQTIMRMLNNALNELYTKIEADHPVLRNHPHAYFQFDIESQLISLVVPNIIIADTNVYLNKFDPNTGLAIVTPQPQDTIQIFANSILYRLLDGIPSLVLVENLSVFENVLFMFLVEDKKNNHVYGSIIEENSLYIPSDNIPLTYTDQNTTYSYNPSYFELKQEYKNVSAWNSLISIVFLTAYLPIQYEYIPSITEFNDSGASFRAILTDFVPSIESAGEQRSRIIYVPQAQYRYIDLKTSQPLSRIDVKIYWEDKDQNLYPLRISYGETNTIKLMFVKKSVINNKLLIK